MTASDLLNGIRTHGVLTMNALKERGVRVLQVEFDRLGAMTVQIGGGSVQQALKQLGRGDLRRRADDLYPYQVVWAPTPGITVFALVTLDMARRLLTDQDMHEEAPAVAATGA